MVLLLLQVCGQATDDQVAVVEGIPVPSEETLSVAQDRIDDDYGDDQIASESIQHFAEERDGPHTVAVAPPPNFVPK